MKRLLVVPQKTSRTPQEAWEGEPGLFCNDIDLVEISCVFTWDKKRCEELAYKWEPHAKRVIIGGPAYNDPGGEFEPGRYLEIGNVLTSRGCVNNCPWCYVPQREGTIREITIKEGNIIQDNNILACSRRHIEKVFEMLKTQKAIDFVGGLDARLLKDWHIELLRGINLKQLFIAYDDKSQRETSLVAIRKLAKVFPRNKTRCYVMIGRNETISEATERLIDTWEAGALPFAQVYDQLNDAIGDWKKLARQWQRPAITKTLMKDHQ